MSLENTFHIASFEELERLVEESPRNYDLELLRRAYRLAEASHKGQCRKSGEPYITHPVAVAELLLELGMDTETLAAAILHDVVEDTDITLEQITQQFGADIALLVDGVTKLTQINFSSIEERQAENLRKMLFAMSKDIRVMVIKLCDRLHNMRTGDAWAPQKQRDKSLETMEVYAPIAHRLGIYHVKEELEDRALRYLDPIGYNEIKNLIEKNSADQFLEKISNSIKARLQETGMTSAHLEYRLKSIYGIYRKMYMHNKEFAEIYDIYAVRIFLDNVAECYNALGVIHDMYHPLPNRFKDYISTPKPNGYKSLHTTVLGHEGIPFEVQIRTWEMHQTAEYGVAAHWKYKDGGGNNRTLDERLVWVRQLLETQRDSEDTEDLLRNIKSDLLPEEVFVFTPKGDVISLPAGATIIDFAYAIHSAVGNRMIGAKLNGKMVPIEHKVQTGEIIEIVTGPANKGPSRDWLKVATTSEAKNKIRTWFKKERKEENIAEGKAALEKELRRNLISIPEDKYEGFMTDIAKKMRLNTIEELYAALGYGGILMSKLIVRIKEEYNRVLKTADPTEVFQIPKKTGKSSNGVVVEGIDNCLVKFSKCCSPLPGDEIVGFITRGFGVSIHKRDCANAQNLDSPRWVKAYWDAGVRETFTATLELISMDNVKGISEVTTQLGNMRVPINAMNMRSTKDGRMQMSITISVNNAEHLTNVIEKLQKLKHITNITRV
ncbi:MAG: bifunctional (p)ppGpp synthetase/guanosine-3',5'-bis(diphosphate) 3'-pyrophosphohydrolase [Oscillospiraceae bacterium]|nr:bifunctional (p)ppGpp synthetase/guanosine-3',5'-bis(diphosphate) 3'-pyrophosphohydrolase [Oscillospiraceae bacterium]